MFIVTEYAALRIRFPDYILYSYIYAREEEGKGQPDEFQTQSQRAKSYSQVDYGASIAYRRKKTTVCQPPRQLSVTERPSRDPKLHMVYTRLLQ